MLFLHFFCIYFFEKQYIINIQKEVVIIIEKLKIKAIYDDFVRNVTLTNEQIKILNMLINRDSIIKISMEIGASQRTIGYEIRKLKNLYNDYTNLQLLKAKLLEE